MPVCSNCGKESKNQRVCPFCYTPYASGGSSGRSTNAFPAPKRPKSASAGTAGHVPPLVAWGLPLLIVALIVWRFIIATEPNIPIGEVMKDVVTAPMTQTEAEAVVKRMKETAEVVIRGNDVSVSIPPNICPDRRSGQLALAQQYARALEQVDGVRRIISFYEPGGKIFARADATGVMMMK